MRGVDLDLTFDQYGNAIDRGRRRHYGNRYTEERENPFGSERRVPNAGEIGIDHHNRIHSPTTSHHERDISKGTAHGAYYKVSDEGNMAVKYPSTSPPLVIQSRPKSSDEETVALSARMVIGRSQGTSRLSSHRGTWGNEKDKDSGRDESSRPHSPNARARAVVHLPFTPATPSPIHLPPPSYASTPLTPHQTYEYDKAIAALRNIKELVRTHKPWLFDSDEGALKISHSYVPTNQPAEVLARSLVLPTYQSALAGISLRHLSASKSSSLSGTEMKGVAGDRDGDGQGQREKVSLNK